MPAGILYQWEKGEDELDLAAAIPIKEPLSLEGSDFINIHLPETETYLVDYYGPYDGAVKAHDALEQFHTARDLPVPRPVVEQYVTDPGQEPDPNKWLTKVFYPAKAQG